MDEREARDRIIRAILTSTYRWRTPRGISKDSGVPLPQVMELLERSDAFVRARKGNSRGEPLYTTTEKYRSNTTLGQRLLAALTNRIPE